MEKISVTRGLTTLKLLDKRITKEIHQSTLVTYKVGEKINAVNFDPVASLQSINDLIELRSKIKTSIMASNTVTVVKIGDKKMTVAEAIELKDSISYKKTLLNKMMNDYGNAHGRTEMVNSDVQRRLDNLIESNFGGKDSKVKDDEYDAIAKPFLKRNQAEVFDPAKISEKIDELELELDTFESEVDLILSESNASTFIEV